jgi:L-2-hydroxyglutarate oxidase LhgO
MLYELCTKQGIPHRNTKKWLVCQDEQDLEACVKVEAFSKNLGVPTRFISLEEGKRQEPDVHAETGILESRTTGIVDSHSLMSYLEGDFQERGGDSAFHSPVTRIEPLNNGKAGYRLYVAGEDGTEDSVTAETLINSAGLFACNINNMVLPKDRHWKPFFAKGTYFSYAASHPKPNTLVYPAPSSGHSGLGTHLTLDMTGRVRFGPDVEWVDDPNDLKPHPSRVEEAIGEIKKYLPGVKVDAIDLDYCGIRPKLGKTTSQHGKGFQDFIIQREEGFPGFINLLGIESPGLTSSLAIGDEVENLLYR